MQARYRGNPMSLKTVLTLCVSLVAVMFSACKCGGEGVRPIYDDCKGVQGQEVGKDSSCMLSSECGDHFTCAAPKDKPSVQCCIFADRKCATEADCCPGQTCPTDRKKCFDKYLSCETDADCGEKGDRFCETYSDTYGNSTRCRFKVCGALGACPDGQACFQGQCMADLPCGGSCDTGKGCVPDIDRCQDYSKFQSGRPPKALDGTPVACPMTCNAGFIATFKDPRNIWDSCLLPKVACVCAELPGLKSEDLGRFSSMAGDPGKGLYVSEYDGQYGDLVVAKYDLNGQKTGLEYVDGVPSAMVKFGPSGARGGVVEPGDDVGRYTDAVVASGGIVYVSYYDVTHGDLKVAIRAADGKWSKYQLDGDFGDVGLYTSIAVDDSNLPGIAYFQRGGDSSFNAADCPAPVPTGPKAFITALKYAKAKVASPPGKSDWTITTIACQSRPTPPCYSCGTSDVCADPGQGADCYQPATTCTGCDANTETCVTVGTAAQCAKKYNPSNLSDITDGVGLFTSIAFNAKEANIAFMKRTTPPPMMGTRFNPDSDLWGVKVSASNMASPLVKLDDAGDTGYFPDVKIDPTTKSVAIGYHDFTSRKFKFYYAPTLQTGVTIETIDTGTGAANSGESGWVGTDSALIFGASNALYAVYQDATKGDLKLAKRGATWQLLPAIHTAGAVGFFADGLFIDGKMFASHAKIHARLVAGEPHVDNSLIVEPVPAQ